MSELNELKTPKRKLTNVTFDFTQAHLAYTDESQGGAASGKNTPYLLKAADIDDLTDEQKAILEEIGEESIPLDKNSMVDNNTPSSSSEDDNGEDENLNKGNDNTMSEQLEKQVAALTLELAITKAETTLSGYNFDKEVQDELAKTMASMEDSSAVIKALDVLSGRVEEAVDKAAELTKSKGEQEETPLQKALGKEEGHEEVVDKSSEPTLIEKAIEAKAKLQGAK